MSKKKSSWFKISMTALFGLVVVGCAIFSIMWFVPSIHEKVFTNTVEQVQVDDSK